MEVKHSGLSGLLMNLHRGDNRNCVLLQQNYRSYEQYGKILQRKHVTKYRIQST